MQKESKTFITLQRLKESGHIDCIRESLALSDEVNRLRISRVESVNRHIKDRDILREVREKVKAVALSLQAVEELAGPVVSEAISKLKFLCTEELKLSNIDWRDEADWLEEATRAMPDSDPLKRASLKAHGVNIQ